LDGVITLVDAVNANATLDAHVEAVKQVAVADRIVLTKADLVTDPRDVETLRARLRQINPGAELLEAGDKRTDVAALFDCGLYNPATKSAEVQRWLGEEAAHDHHHGDHDHDDHGHDHDSDHRHDSRVRSYSLVHDGPVPFSAIEMFLDLLRSAHGERLLR
ncbi:MAG: GTP-binding protein, partial [Mesorhizobium sp.]